MVDDLGLQFPVLVDADLSTIQAYGIVNQDRPAIPHPTVVIIDRAGSVQFVHLDEDYRRRPPPDSLVEALRALDR